MIVFSIILNIMLLNLFIGSYIHRKEKMSVYNCPKWFAYMYTTLGCLTLLFKKRFHEYKKYYYIKNKVIEYETMILASSETLISEDKTIKYHNYKRYLKIRDIKNRQHGRIKL